MEHLFSRPLSECSVGPLRTLCDEVGRSIEARRRENEASGGFSSRIEYLSEELESLESRHAELTKRHGALVERYRVLEVQNEELQKKSARLENRNGKLEKQNERLEAQFNDQSAEVGHLFGYIGEFTKGVQSFWPLLGSQDPETGSIGVDEGSEELCNVL
ncbi:hypothetical protein K4K57_006153 [Colletotrichum sp. SAR 10_99]|nr:hypothetical protein K4K57_006153 [Colletotrichum sp. SAR 10_99]